MVERAENWPKLLSNYLDERRFMKFEWGKHDCMAFVAKAVEALTGHDFFTEFSDYHDEASAKLMLENNGGPFGIITQCLGFADKNFMSAGRGDVVIVEMPELTGGIVDDSGQHIALVTEKHGLRRVPLSKAIRIWRY